METFLIIVCGVLFGCGTYMLLSRQVLKIIFGAALFTHAAHLLLLAMGGLKKGAPPLLGEEAGAYADPIPQALILTSIVISFALTAFMLVLAYRTYAETGMSDLEQMKGLEYEP